MELSSALIGALIGAGAAVVVQIIAACVNWLLESRRLDFERDRWVEDQRARRTAAVEDYKRRACVEVVTETDKVIRAVDEFVGTGKLVNPVLVDPVQLLRSAAALTLFAPELVDPLRRLSEATSSIGQSKRDVNDLSSALTNLHRLRDELLHAMRQSLSI